MVIIKFVNYVIYHYNTQVVYLIYVLQFDNFKFYAFRIFLILVH